MESPAGFTVRYDVIDRTSAPLVPVIVMEIGLPATLAPVVVTVRVAGPEPMTDGGLKVAVAPFGSPEADKVTAPAKPLTGWTETVYCALRPAATIIEPVRDNSEKSADDPTVILNAFVA